MIHTVTMGFEKQVIGQGWHCNVGWQPVCAGDCYFRIKTFVPTDTML